MAELADAHAAIPRVLFLAYFAVHAFPDDVFFYKANGDAVRPGPDPQAERDTPT